MLINLADYPDSVLWSQNNKLASFRVRPIRYINGEEVLQDFILVRELKYHYVDIFDRKWRKTNGISVGCYNSLSLSLDTLESISYFKPTFSFSRF
ncbi:MAG: hypothetical protein V2A75_00860 [Pseudomonadota bacterium]